MWLFLARATVVGLVFAVMCPADVGAQDAADISSRFVMVSWTEQDGLPSGVVEALGQTPDGYLWVGTQSGLLRFDGVRFVRFEAADDLKLRTQGVSALHADRDGSLWVGFAGSGGVSRIARSRVINYGAADGLTHGRVHAITDTADGTVWAGGLGGLFRFRHDRWEPVGMRDGFSGQRVTSLYEDRHGNLWVGADAGVFVRRRHTQQLEHHSPSLARANGFSEDPDGSLLVSTPTGVFRTLTVDGRFHPLWPDGSDNYFRLRHDRHGNLWVGTRGGGLLHVRARAARQGAATRFTVRTELVGDLVWALFDDREGNIWVGTQTGLTRLTPSQVRSIAIPGPSRVVRAVEATRDGAIWVATSAGLIRFVSDEGEWREQRVTLGGLDVTALHTDRHDTLWVAALSGLYRYERNRLTALQVSGATQSNLVLAMTSDHRGSLWLREANGRLLLWRAGELSTVGTSSVAERSVLALYTDSRGDVWVGFADGGVVVFRDGDVERSVEREISDGDPINTFFEDENGVMWIGSATRLSRFDDGHLATLSLARSGIPIGRLIAILNDDEANLWLSGRAGIVRLDLDEFDRAVANGSDSIRYRLLDTSDGLRGSPGSIGSPSAVRARDGTLAFLTGHSVSMVSPGLLSDGRPPPAARIEGVVADRRSFSLARDLQLPPRTNRIQIDYTAMTLVASERVRFRYWLEGFDEDWVDAGHSRQAVYTNVPPGRYHFHVATSNKEGLWSESSPTWGFVVQPSFYQTTWFIGGWVVTAGAAFWGAWLLRVRHLRQGFALVLGERARVAREIHDTLLQTLVGLTLKIDAVEGQIESATDVAAMKRQLANVRRQLQRSIRETRESIGDLRCPALERRPLAAALREAGKVTCGGRLSLELAVDGQPVPYPKMVEEQLLRIAQESLHNVVRHAEARLVRVTLQYATNGITLRVADDGCGFDTDKAADGPDHWGVIIMRERTAQIGGRLDIRSRPDEGTVVEVSVPASLTRPTRDPGVDGDV